ncbi:MAG TPA: DUF6677 family protein [Thermoanaerobaculia bacterium]|nr:DUF6677 family protein [Thermoanaerobaculia bacterium]
MTAIVLAFLLPGAGHFYLGKRARAIGFFCVIVFLFVVGLSIDGELYTWARSGGSFLRVLASLGSMGSGVLYFIAALLGFHGDMTSITYEYGSAFTVTAGLMNLLLMLDVYDISEGRKE